MPHMYDSNLTEMVLEAFPELAEEDNEEGEDKNGDDQDEEEATEETLYAPDGAA